MVSDNKLFSALCSEMIDKVGWVEERNPTYFIKFLCDNVLRNQNNTFGDLKFNL